MNIKAETAKSKINKLMKAIGIDRKSSEVVDLSNSSMVASSIQELKVSILSDKDKDVWLYYLLKEEEGRSIVFCNSITGVLRLRYSQKIIQRSILRSNSGVFWQH